MSVGWIAAGVMAKAYQRGAASSAGGTTSAAAARIAVACIHQRKAKPVCRHWSTAAGQAGISQRANGQRRAVWPKDATSSNRVGARTAPLELWRHASAAAKARMARAASRASTAAAESSLCGDQKRKMFASDQVPKPRGVNGVAVTERAMAPRAQRRGSRGQASMVKAAAKSSPPGESQTESHTATGRVRATRRGDQWKVTVRQADMRSTASPKPLQPLAGPERTTASRAGTSGPRPRHARRGSGQNQISTANQATKTWRFCQPRGPAKAKAVVAGAAERVSGFQNEGPDSSQRPDSSAAAALIASGPRRAISAPRTNKAQTASATRRRQLLRFSWSAIGSGSFGRGATLARRSGRGAVPCIRPWTR